MTEDEKFNMRLRSAILRHSLRLERLCSKITEIQFRILKKETKTLGNKSSDLSFKNKIDILYDMDEINSEQYSDFLKFMEIRNQFVHNFSCTSFIKLKEINKDCCNYIVKRYPSKITNDDEKAIEDSYIQLTRKCLKDLLEIHLELSEGLCIDMMKYSIKKTWDNRESVAKQTREEFTKTYIPTNPFSPVKLYEVENIISTFQAQLFIDLTKENIKNIEAIADYKQIFTKRKINCC